MSTYLEKRIAKFSRWRSEMVAGITVYKSWLDANGVADIQQSLRIYDLIERLKHDCLTLALIGEVSRGKTELINAMLFGNFKRPVLPAANGRTTMCPIELFHDPAQQPCVRLLPIESRQRNGTVASLKKRPAEWIKIELDLSSESALAGTLRVLAETKTVGHDEALALGLFDYAAAVTTRATDPQTVEIPRWRHALINYPHPLLTHGLVVLDTSALNALGTEPELTMGVIPNAHAVLFLLAADCGVTGSDLEVWRKYVQPRVARRVVVLNKVDLFWDEDTGEQGSEDKVQALLEQTARELELPPGSVLQLSAKNALAARVRGDAELLERSGIAALERRLADEIVPAKREILRAAVVREIGTMVDSSRLAIKARFNALRAEYRSLTELRGKNCSVAQAMLTRLEAERIAYLASVERYHATLGELNQQGAMLLNSLSDDALEQLINTDREFIEDAWTTAGLIKNMHGLFDHFTAQAERILRFSKAILALVNDTYAHFHAKGGFERLYPPPFNLEQRTLAMHHLKQTTIDYCRHPKQLFTEKHFLVPDFYETLVAGARQVFEATRDDTKAWLRMALTPLTVALKEHESMLNMRIDNLARLQRNVNAAAGRAKELQQEFLTLREQYDVLQRIKTNMEAAPAALPATRQEPSPANDAWADPGACAA